ncbi:major Facilitator Superfamily (MFS) [Phytophthora infestans T30-4]|uniref:Major Facilitator Superfamily (MFS) n=1 Tax=Phytophthora infestans (strain T30-4) TaxID=403677 RepID=D0NK28_PHYIT|nr:major Facilitator Superfamily (MFS) [Phytophthora infestans T30-4]EEY59865.1 major Facilitator Superfamily (MFS) [Phytophthora infestans T30-4]|eukprot:XP_002900550.1 major Facilitator Superfamily (MFS) [Phytophthora infestans T30-4]
MDFTFGNDVPRRAPSRNNCRQPALEYFGPTLQELGAYPSHEGRHDRTKTITVVDLELSERESVGYLDASSASSQQRRGFHHRVNSSNRPSFALFTDPLQADRATEIRLFSFARPHMRAFHLAWLSFFVAFFGWFSIPPLMPTIKEQLKLTQAQVDNSNIISLASTMVGRLLIGSLCDRCGARSIQAALLVIGAIPVASAALAFDYVGFMFVRFFIGLVGCTFVSTTYWTSTMFSKEVVGSANAVAAGWGNLGAGATYLITPLLFDLITVQGGMSDNSGWRVTLLLPAFLMLIVGICTYFFSDDCPQGNYVELKKTHAMADKPKAAMLRAFITVARQPVAWILAFQYACSLGVQIQVHNVLSLYYFEDFRRFDCDPTIDEDNCRLLTQTKASLISSCFGLMCIFARAIGGYISDIGNRHWDMKGRISTQLVCLTGQAIFLYVYSHIRGVEWSVPCLIAFGFFAQASTGTTYGIVPYICPDYTGVTSGIVGAGGNVGGLMWGLLFKIVEERALSFRYLSFFVMSSAILSVCIRVKDERSIWSHEPSRYSRRRTEQTVQAFYV